MEEHNKPVFVIMLVIAASFLVLYSANSAITGMATGGEQEKDGSQNDQQGSLVKYYVEDHYYEILEGDKELLRDDRYKFKSVGLDKYQIMENANLIREVDIGRGKVRQSPIDDPVENKQTWQTETDLQGNIKVKRSVVGDSLRVEKHEGDDIVITRKAKGESGNVISTSYKLDCTGTVCKEYECDGDCSASDDSWKEVNSEDYAARDKEYQEIVGELKEDYGVTGIKTDQSKTSFTSGSGTLTVTHPQGSYGEPDITFDIGDTKFKVQKGKGILGTGLLQDTSFIHGKQKYGLSDDCKDSDYCLKRGKEQITLDEKTFEMLQDTDELSAKAAELHQKKYIQGPDYMQQRKEQYYSQIEAKTRGKLTQILNSYIDWILGPFSEGVPAAVCGDRMIRQETSFKNRVSGIPVPTSTYQSEMEQDIMEGTRTIIAFGEAAMLSDDVYRYEIMLKMIGDESMGHWKVFLYNSCDDEDSMEFWMDEGSISDDEVFKMLYAGQEGEDMVFECGVDPGCRFDQVCVETEDDLACFDLGGDTEGICQRD